MQERIDEIDKRKEIELAERRKVEKMSKLEKQKYENEKKCKINSFHGLKKKKSIQDEEREVHEAYQFLLAEYHSRVKLRMRKKIKAVNTIRKLAETSKKETADKPSDQNVSFDTLGNN